MEFLPVEGISCRFPSLTAGAVVTPRFSLEPRPPTNSEASPGVLMVMFRRGPREPSDYNPWRAALYTGLSRNPVAYQRRASGAASLARHSPRRAMVSCPWWPMFGMGDLGRDWGHDIGPPRKFRGCHPQNFPHVILRPQKFFLDGRAQTQKLGGRRRKKNFPDVKLHPGKFEHGPHRFFANRQKVSLAVLKFSRM